MSDSISTPLRSAAPSSGAIETFSLEDDDSFEVETPDFHFPWLAKRDDDGTAKALPESPADDDPLRWSRVTALKQGNLSSTPSSASSSHVLGPNATTTSWSSASPPEANPQLESRPTLPLSSSVNIGDHDRNIPPLSARVYSRVVSAPVPGSAMRGVSAPKTMDDISTRTSFVTPGLTQRTMAKSTASSARRVAKPNANLSRFGGPARRVIPHEEEEEEEDAPPESPAHRSEYAPPGTPSGSTLRSNGIGLGTPSRTRQVSSPRPRPPSPLRARQPSPPRVRQPSPPRARQPSPHRTRPTSPYRDHRAVSPPSHIIPLETSERHNRLREPVQLDKPNGHVKHHEEDHRHESQAVRQGVFRQQEGQDHPAPLQASRPAPPVRPQVNQQPWVPPAEEQSRPRAAPVTAGPKKLFVVNGVPYERLGVLGKGGSSKVYSVLCPTKRVVYALKRVGLERADAETYQSYTNEIELLRRLRGHDRIIQLIDHQITFTPNNRPKLLMMVMECGEIDFAALLDEQRDKPLNWNFIGLYWQQMLEAVQAVHAENVVHTDLKPANFVLVKGRLKIIDFGIAKAIANDTVNIQRDQQIGTVNYMSPEAIQKMNNQKVLKLSFPSDVWSLGCILYQMIYGSPPFHHIPGGPLIKMNKIADPNFRIDYPSTTSTNPTPVPPDAISAMQSCLEYNKDKRLTIPQLLAHSFLCPLATSRSTSDSTPITKDQIAMLVNFVLGENGLKQLGPDDRSAEDLFLQLRTQNESQGR